MKPENVVLDSKGHALITDFGLSKKKSNLDEINKSFCGTPAYLPLEIVTKQGHTRMADWYEYGITLYELAVGIPPYFADTKSELYDQIKAGIVRFPRNVSENFKDLIKKLMAPKYEKRLGFNGDAEEIKEHPWFAGIDWEDVYNRKLPMPIITRSHKYTETIKTKFTEKETQSKNRLGNWEYTS